MKIKYINSATVIIESNGRILCDPWLTDSAYYGAWVHYPPFTPNLDDLNNVDAIYVSHIHPDHMKGIELLNKAIPVYIHKYASPFLRRNLERHGFHYINEIENGDTVEIKDIKLTIYAADDCNPELCQRVFGCSMGGQLTGSLQIDSLALFEADKRILNTNDCPYELCKDVLKKIGEIDLLMHGYSSAGPYPQCFNVDQEKEREVIKNKRLTMGKKFIETVKPKYSMPFAGLYWLAGRNHYLNKWRAVPTLKEAKDFYKDCLILQRNQEWTIGDPIPEYRFSPEPPEGYLKDIEYDYEKDGDPRDWVIESLVDQANVRFERKKEELGYKQKKPVVITSGGVNYEIFNGVTKINDMPKRYLRYIVPPKLLNRILRGPKYAHWNNAEIGSHIRFERVPNVHDRDLHHLMNFFHT